MLHRRPLGFALLVLALMMPTTPAVAQNPEQIKRSRTVISADTRNVRTSLDAHALESIREAAENGDVRVQRILGMAYQEGRILPKDHAQAALWYRKAAEQGDPLGQRLLGAAYDSGSGVPEDHLEAARWYRRAADQGQAWAQLSIGSMYQRGRGVPQNDAEAAEWFRKSAMQGNRGGQNALGAMYESGRGVAEDHVRAFAWYDLASKQGGASAARFKDKLRALMTAEQIAGAHKLSTQLEERFSQGK